MEYVVMEKSQGVVGRALISGSIGGLATALAAALAGKREEDSYAAPLNATSHIIWGDKAAHKDEASLKYTVTGFLLNYAATIFWALLYEKWFGRATTRATARGGAAKSRSPGKSIGRPILGAAAVTAGAYVVDYYLIPERFTPGFEKRLSGKSLVTVFGVLAVGLAARDMINAGKRGRE